MGTVSSQKRVVVTGMGVIASLGHNVDEFWSNILAGKCGIDTVTLFDAKDYLDIAMHWSLFPGLAIFITVLAISFIGVLIFAGLTAYDTQRLKDDYVSGVIGEAPAKAQVWGALSLYLNFVNLFQLLLSLFGQRQEQ